MCGCGGVVEAAIIGYTVKKVYDMSSKSKSTSCKVCHAVAIPDKEICPECLIEITEDPDTLDLYEDDSEKEDVEPQYRPILSYSFLT